MTSIIDRYFSMLAERLDNVRRTQSEAIARAAEACAQSIANDKLAFTFGTGHGALPWGYASELANPKVAWFEGRNAGDPNDKLRVYNGFTFLQLDGTGLNETFYDENGGVAWIPNQTTPATAGG